MTDTRPGLIEGARRLAATLARSLKTRMELAQVELEQERQRLTRGFMVMLATVLSLAFGTLLLVIWLLLVLPAEWRSTVAGMAALTCFLAAGAGAFNLRRARASRPAVLSDLLSVVQGDIEALTARPASPAPADAGTDIANASPPLAEGRA